MISPEVSILESQIPVRAWSRFTTIGELERLINAGESVDNILPAPAAGEALVSRVMISFDCFAWIGSIDPTTFNFHRILQRPSFPLQRCLISPRQMWLPTQRLFLRRQRLNRSR